MSKDCPKRREFKDIHSLVVVEQEQKKEPETESKVEEVKD